MYGGQKMFEFKDKNVAARLGHILNKLSLDRNLAA
jgi:hypothetical protein